MMVASSLDCLILPWPPTICLLNTAKVTLVTSKLDHITPMLKILQLLLIPGVKTKVLLVIHKVLLDLSLPLLCPYLLLSSPLLTPFQPPCCPCLSLNTSGMHLLQGLCRSTVVWEYSFPRYLHSSLHHALYIFA